MRTRMRWAVATCLTAALLAGPTAVWAAKPKLTTKPAPPVATAKPPQSMPQETKTGETKTGETKAPAAADQVLARLVAATQKALKAAPQPGGPDLAMAVLVSLARSSMVSALHGHFALAGLGQAVRTGGMAASDVAVMARTMAQNYAGLAEAFGALAGQKSFEPELANLFASLQILAQRAQVASDALSQYATLPNEASKIKAFEDALEDYRSRVQALFAQLEQGAQKP